MTSKQSSSYACPCVNVRITVNDGGQDGRAVSRKDLVYFEREHAATTNTRVLEEDIAIAKGMTSQIVVAQPLLTTRIPLPVLSPSTSQDEQTWTALACLNCNTNVYAVDKAQQEQQQQMSSSSSISARHVGFAAVGNGRDRASNNTAPLPSDLTRSAAIDDEDLLIPAPGVGSMRILSGVLCGADAIQSLSASQTYSQSYGLIVAGHTIDNEGVNANEDLQAARASTATRSGRSGARRAGALSDEARLDTDTRRTASPQRAIPLASSKRTSSSPSPARRRRLLALAEEEEEEQGEDLDTLHLLETLLPHLPTSVVFESTQVRSNDTSVRRLLSTQQRAPEKSPSSNRRLDAKLDSIAIAQLREKRDMAQRELYGVLKQKSAEIARLENRLRSEARQLRDRALQHATSRAELQQKQQDSQLHSSRQAQEGDLTSGDLDMRGNAEERESMSPLFLRRRPLVPVMEKSRSQDSDTTRWAGVGSTAASTVGSGSSIGGAGVAAGGNGAQQGSTPITGNLAAPQTTSAPFVGSYLSASFAMRGRDLPSQANKEQERSEEEEEEWFAHKKRLRERYPHADHSALPSAVNSDDEGAVEVKEVQPTASTDEEEEGRGRGRARAADRGAINAQKTPTPPRKKDSMENQQQREQGERKRTSRERRHQSDNVDQPEQNIRAKRGALKTVNGSGPSKWEAVTSPVAEKKVAFASTTEEVEAAPVPPAEDPLETSQPVEPGDPVFEIDEDLDPDDTTPTSSDITLDEKSMALQEGQRGAAHDRLEDDDDDDEGYDKEQQADTDDEDTSLLDESVVKSLPVVGSFAALAEVESRSRRNSKTAAHSQRSGSGLETSNEVDENDDFDPASLRFDGREVYSSVTAGYIPNTSFAIATPASERALSEGARGENARLPPHQSTASSLEEKEALLAGFPHERLHRSSAIGFRVTVGEAEAHLSGLLAPNVPSHRNLYSARRQSGLVARRYKLFDDGKPRESEFDTEEKDDMARQQPKGKRALKKTKPQGSEPIAAARSPAWAQNVGVASTTPNTEDSNDLLLARSVPIDVRRHAFGAAGAASSTIHRDGTSGFDLEPKTSLPYQEKLFTPSLRKATRHLTQKSQAGSTSTQLSHRPSLAAISDASDNAEIVQHVVPGRPPLSRDHSSKDGGGAVKARGGSIAVGAGANQSGIPIVGADTSTASAAMSTNAPPFTYTVPSSITRGFEPERQPATAASAIPLTGAALIAGASDTLGSAQNSPMLGSSAGTGRSSRVRSPRPPYVAPPPPTSAELRLTPDAQHRPAALPLATMMQADVYEEGEEEDDVDSALQFMHIVENLKRNKRTGWLHHRVQQPESIADHMYRMALLSMLLPQAELDIGKCVQLCLVHDLAEALVGDLTPLDNVGKAEKLQREEEALGHLVHGLLAGSEAGRRIEALWHEYEERQTPESRAVKDLDRFELALQAIEYERRYRTADLQPFYAGSSGAIQQPRIQRWIRRLAQEREQLWKDSQFAYEQTYPSDDATVTLPPWKTPATTISHNAHRQE